MIYSTINIQKNEFEKLLTDTKILALKKIDLSVIKSGNSFENFIFENSLYQTPDRAFPDIIANNYWGVEVKYTKDDKWKSIGNSILESSRVSGVEKIYIFFGKCGGEIDIKFRQYEYCLSGIAVTHYPRYEIDMELEEGKSIFNSMKISYDELRKSSKPVKLIRKFYQENLKENDSLWWIDDEEPTKVNLTIKDFKNLSKNEKDTLISEGFILYPEVLNSLYSQLCVFWLTNYSIICPNMRDQYSAGGKIQFSKLNQTEQNLFKNLGFVELSKIHYKFLFSLIEKISNILEEIDLKKVSNCWGIELKNRNQMIELWKKKINFYTPMNFQYSISYCFNFILKNK